ncbi:MAG TPA: ThiF family adenylyltransferase [Thermoleophilia bacterium]|nr:ThiF family adenylyltransferase [Thermoleophilia bacterium]
MLDAVEPLGAGAIPARYSRQVLFDGIGREGQARIMRTRVAIVGCGALGSLQAALLVRAGVGELRIIDRDLVEESNLQRQLLFDEEDARSLLPKAVAAEGRLRQANSAVVVEGLVDDVTPSSIGRLLAGFDVILDGTDNFETRLLVNDFAVKSGIPWIYGACVSSYGMTFPILPGETACLRCVFPEAPSPGSSPSCDTAGVLGSIVGTVASLQVVEALKIVSGHPEKVGRTITVLDLWENRHDTVDLPPRVSECRCCGLRHFDYLEGERRSEATTLCGRGTVQITPVSGAGVDLDELETRLAPLGRVERNRFLLRAEIDGYTLTVFGTGRAIVGGAKNTAAARSVYARYVGG